MIEDVRGAIDYDERGRGPAVVLVPGSCSTGAAWRPVMTAMGEGLRFITTSLLGYGGTAERRSDTDTAIAHEAEVVEAVIARAGGPVHLVGHSFGGLVSLAVAGRGRAPLASLAVLEAPAMMLLRDEAEDMPHFDDFRAMTERYFAAFSGGEADAIGRMIDFYGGDGTFASWPERVRAYARDTTAVNIRDWATAFGFALPPDELAAAALPSHVVWGERSHPAARRANRLLARRLGRAHASEIAGAAHFMIATHPGEIAALLVRHIGQAEAAR